MRTLEAVNEVLAGKRMSERTAKNYKYAFGSLAKMYDELPLRKVEINKWLVSLDGYGDQTIRLWFTVLRSGYDYLEGNFELFKVNPFKGLESPRVKKQRRRYFNAQEIMMILQACKDDFEMALVMTLVDSGCRIGALEKLKGGDIGDSCFNALEKTGERRYRLDGRICEVLKRLAGDDDNLVFKLSASALSMRVIRICRRAGMKGSKLGAHTLRHSAGSLVASETKNVMAVKALLQHDNIQTSMLYIHDVEEEIQKSISPLQIVADRVKTDVGFGQKRLTMGEASGEAVEAVEAVEGDGYDELVYSMFPEIGEGVEIRPLLKSEDLELIRKGFMELAVSGKYSLEVGRARGLMKRMLRKAKIKVV